MSAIPRGDRRSDMVASTAIRQPIPATPRVTFKAALTLLAAGRPPTIEAVVAEAKNTSNSSPSLTSIGFDQIIRCQSDWLRLGYDGVPAENMQFICRNGRMRRIVLARNDAVPYGSDDTNERMSAMEGVYPSSDEVASFARHLGMAVIDISKSASRRTENVGHIQADTPALLVTSKRGGATIRADAFSNGFVVGLAVLTSADAPP